MSGIRTACLAGLALALIAVPEDAEAGWRRARRCCRVGYTAGYSYGGCCTGTTWSGPATAGYACPVQTTGSQPYEQSTGYAPQGTFEAAPAPTPADGTAPVPPAPPAKAPEPSPTPNN